MMCRASPETVCFSTHALGWHSPAGRVRVSGGTGSTERKFQTESRHGRYFTYFCNEMQYDNKFAHLLRSTRPGRLKTVLEPTTRRRDVRRTAPDG